MGIAVIDLFEEGEAIADSLSNLRGIEDALVQVLEPVLAQEPDRGRRVYALIEAMGLFRAQAAAGADRITRSGVGI
jgi:hypothetical protein